MKKILLFIVALSIAVAGVPAVAYEGEILFRELSWDIDAVSFRDAIIAHSREESPDEKKVEQMITDWSWADFFDQDANNMRSSVKVSDYGAQTYMITVLSDDGFKVAGHPVSSIYGTAMSKVENGTILEGAQNSRMITAGYFFDLNLIEDEERVHADLLKKLNDIYGEFDYTETQSEGTYIYHVWYGANNTYVKLSALKKDGKISNVGLDYGLTNVLEMIEDFKKSSEIADVDVTNSVDGL